ncbi:MAG: CocE/NonD family hydrolase [Solirubrobacterales bacterium]
MKRAGRRVVAVAIAAFALAAPAAHARDAIVNSFDGEPIVTHFFPAPGLEPGATAPTILVGHGWGGSGATGPPGQYAAAGYNVVTWDARGFGGSGGTVMIDHPEFEGRDAQALIDFVAAQPEAELDAPGDPRVGMDGPSYGGGVQFITAARDDRVDAITPTIAWNSLVTSLFKEDSVKAGWGLALAGLGVPTSLLPGVFSPAGVQLGHQSPQFYSLVTNGLATGRFLPQDVAWLTEHGPGPNDLLDEIEAPTLIAQGTVDTLFTLDEAHRNFTTLKENGVPVKMLWFCGGHGVCLTESDSPNPIAAIAGDTGRVRQRKLAWFARHLQGDSSADVGPEFEWIDEAGEWHASDAYPPAGAGELRGSRSGTIPLIPGELPGSGILLFATESLLGGLTVPIEAPPDGAAVVGSPQLDLTYSATGASLAADGKTHVFAQLIDRGRTNPLLPVTNLVVNNLATPIKIELDGRTHQVSVPLERIASEPTAAGYELQLVGQTSLYDLQRAVGVVNVQRAEVSVPLSVPVIGGQPPAPAPATGAGGAAGGDGKGTASKQRKCKRAKKKKAGRGAAAAGKKKKTRKRSCKPKKRKRKRNRR